jgi:hypothetical protein
MFWGSSEDLDGDIFFFSAMYNFANMIPYSTIAKVIWKVPAKKLIKFTTNLTPL